MAPRRRRLRRCGAGRAERPRTCSTASSGPTRSSSIRTSGCSRPFDCVRAALPRPGAGPRRAHPARRLPRPGDRRGRVESLAISRSSSPAGPEACRSGSPSPCTAPTPTATQSSRRWTSPEPGPLIIRARRPCAAAGRAGSVGADLRTNRLGRRTTTRAGRPGCWRSKCAFVTPTRHRSQPCTRFAIVNPLTTANDLALIIESMQ